MKYSKDQKCQMLKAATYLCKVLPDTYFRKTENGKLKVFRMVKGYYLYYVTIMEYDYASSTFKYYSDEGFI